MNEMYKNSHFIRMISSVICTAPNIAVSNTCTEEGPVFSVLHLHTDPTDPLLAIYFSSPLQNDRRNQNLMHLAWKMTEFYQISDVKGETVIGTLKDEHRKKKNELLAFRDWRFQSYCQFSLFCFLPVPFCADQAQATCILFLELDGFPLS